jgi:hypothetical protein
MSLKQRIKSVVLPSNVAPRKLPLGIGRGITMQIDFAHQTLFFLGLYEVELNRHIRKLVRPGARCFDVGGDAGYDALVLAKLTGAKVITLECEPSHLARLKENVALNATLTSLIEPRCAMVGEKTDRERGTLALDDLAYGSDGFVPDFMKIDIEGAEFDALQGAERILRERKPSLIIETHALDIERRVQSLLEQKGYRCQIVNPRRWLKDRRPIEHNRWLIAEGDA